MDLESLNPKVFKMWESQRNGGPDFFQPSTKEDIEQIERLVETRIPEDYREFLLQYYAIGGSINVGAYFFPCSFKKKSVIMGDISLVPWAKLTISAIRAYCNPHPAYEGVKPRISRELLPLTRDNSSTLLIDLRPESFGNVLYLPYVRKQVFGKHANYGWENVGYVAPSFTDFIRELGTEDEIKARYPDRKVV
ncbi:SMI1/KNR4 family protein SUKH-1 [Rhizobium sp. PP-CC-3A-592]|nr:SMI1/KNR4 family protein SUKH-1 [Rhizobium sp. PP-CC-3A-592]